MEPLLKGIYFLDKQLFLAKVWVFCWSQSAIIDREYVIISFIICMFLFGFRSLRLKLEFLIENLLEYTRNVVHDLQRLYLKLEVWYWLVFPIRNDLLRAEYNPAPASQAFKCGRWKTKLFGRKQQCLHAYYS